MDAADDGGGRLMESGTVIALLTALGAFFLTISGIYLKLRAETREDKKWRAEEEERREKRAKELKDEQRAQIQKEREQTDRQINDLVNLLSDELSGFQKRYGELERRHDKLREDHEQMVTAVHRNEETISELEGEVDRLRRELAASQAENQQLREQIATLTARLAEYERTSTGNGTH